MDAQTENKPLQVTTCQLSSDKVKAPSHGQEAIFVCDIKVTDMSTILIKSLI